MTESFAHLKQPSRHPSAKIGVASLLALPPWEGPWPDLTSETANALVAEGLAETWASLSFERAVATWVVAHWPEGVNQIAVVRSQSSLPQSHPNEHLALGMAGTLSMPRTAHLDLTRDLITWYEGFLSRSGVLLRDIPPYHIAVLAYHASREEWKTRCVVDPSAPVAAFLERYRLAEVLSQADLEQVPRAPRL